MANHTVLHPLYLGEHPERVDPISSHSWLTHELTRQSEGESSAKSGCWCLHKMEKSVGNSTLLTPLWCLVEAMGERGIALPAGKCKMRGCKTVYGNGTKVSVAEGLRLATYTYILASPLTLSIHIPEGFFRSPGKFNSMAYHPGINDTINHTQLSNYRYVSSFTRILLSLLIAMSYFIVYAGVDVA